MAITFCATSKSGLGHLRRLTNIAAALRARHPETPLRLMTNAPVAGLSGDEVALYQRIEVVDRKHMAEALAARGDAGPVVVDTAVLPGLGRVPGPLCLVLRETVAERLDPFALEEGRPWDLVVLPNPPGEWQPDPARVPTRRVEPVGWIWRRPDDAAALGGDWAATGPSVLIATGGGGTGDTARFVRRTVEPLLRSLRAAAPGPVDVAQALGPRSAPEARIDGVDRIVDVGSALNQAFSSASVVVSTSGYNSVLEIACADVPALLIAIPRSLDDQESRARRWAGRLGHCHDPDDPEASVAWMAAMLRRRARRPAVDLGPPGSEAAADLLAEMLD